MKVYELAILLLILFSVSKILVTILSSSIAMEIRELKEKINELKEMVGDDK